MKVNGEHFRTVWMAGDAVRIIDQRRLPHEFVTEDLTTCAEVAVAIADMHVRGAGLIGATAGYGMYLAVREAAVSGNFEGHILRCAERLKATRPTAVNLAWAVDRQLAAIKAQPDSGARLAGALRLATEIADEDAACCRLIGEHGVSLIREIAGRNPGRPVNILTHCNAGWLAFVDFGSATSAVYRAHDEGIPVHVWVDETRPRNQGAKLTAWELGSHGVPHTVIVDNAGGHLMQHGMVDLIIVGTDRTTRTGDVANKIGTYLKALAAKDNGIPFYVALPSSSFDWKMRDGVREIPVEKRGPEEVKFADGWHDGKILEVLLGPESSPAENPAFDVTPGRLVTGLITERGICPATEEGILRLFPERN